MFTVVNMSKRSPPKLSEISKTVIERLEIIKIQKEELIKILEKIAEDVKKIKDSVGDVSFLRDVIPRDILKRIVAVDEARKILEEVEKRGADALRSTFEKRLGCAPLFYNENLTFEKLYELYEKTIKLLDSVVNKDKIKSFVCHNMSTYNLTLEELLLREKILRELDNKLKYFSSMKFKFIELSPSEVLWNFIRNQHVDELQNVLNKITSLIEFFAKIDVLNPIDCKYSTALARRLCEDYNDAVEDSKRVLDESKKVFLEIIEPDIAIKELEKCRAEYEKSLIMLQRVNDRIGLLKSKFNIAEADIASALKRIDERVSGLNLSPLQQQIIERLSSTGEKVGEARLERLVRELGARPEELLLELYKLCEMGLVECVVRA
jgi:tetratricopeptide (TPR) repeat protein